MIFVTVGTHEQPFDRLLKKMDQLILENKIKEPVFMQIGYTQYIPKYAKFEKFVTYEQMEKLMNDADIIITHGGPASFMNVLSKGKRPIVVPRQVEYKEHVNNHQLDFVKKVLNKGYSFDVVTDINDLESTINKNKDNISTFNQQSHTEEFVNEFRQIVEELVKK